MNHMFSSIQSVFNKIKEISGRGLQPRPFISFEELQAELRVSPDTLGPFLLHLKKMRLIIFDKKAMSAIKLTILGLHWEDMPR